MKNIKKNTVLIGILWLLLISTRDAHAYLDAGTGSFLLSIILGGLASLVIILKIYWENLLSILGIRKNKETE